VAANLTAEIAAWALQLTPGDVPDDVFDLSRLQLMSVLAATRCGERSTAGKKVAAACASWSPYGDVFERLAWSIAHDFDDYLFAGHTGHSAVWVALLEGADSRGQDVLTAQVVGNELGGRFGAALLLGPHNGQMWAYIHTLIACCVAGRLRRVDHKTLVNALGIGLAMPHYPLLPGFMGPDSKLVTAAFPAVQGLQALDLAQQGLTGPPDILGGRDGLLKSIGRFPRRSAFARLGDLWLSRTLCVKLYPGCAYIDTPVDIVRAMELKAADVRQLELRASPVTLAMERYSARHRRPGIPEPVTVNFSARLSLAIALLDGDISPEALEPDALEARWDDIKDVMHRIKLRSDLQGSLRSLRGAARLLSTGKLDTSTFRMAFPATVEVELNDGTVRTASADVPLGAAGRPRGETARLVQDKFLRHVGDEAALGIIDGIAHHTARELLAALTRQESQTAPALAGATSRR